MRAPAPDLLGAVCLGSEGQAAGDRPDSALMARSLSRCWMRCAIFFSRARSCCTISRWNLSRALDNLALLEPPDPPRWFPSVGGRPGGGWSSRGGWRFLCQDSLGKPWVSAREGLMSISRTDDSAGGEIRLFAERRLRVTGGEALGVSSSEDEEEVGTRTRLHSPLLPPPLPIGISMGSQRRPSPPRALLPCR